MPTRFRADGAALDEADEPCRDLACPSCHLPVPRAVLESRPPIFLSIIGRPAAGKSVFLAAMLHRLRASLPQFFQVGITEPHAPSNGLIHYYEDIMFGAANKESHVKLPKTPEVQEDDLAVNDPFRLYRRVRYGDMERDYPRPMFFQLSPLAAHPHGVDAARFTRTLCLYDNAGEHFEAQSTNQIITQHMAHSSGLFFVFDPVQEPRFLRELGGRSPDPQVAWYGTDRSEGGERVRLTPQHTVLGAANANIKKVLRREASQPLDTPLIVIAAKYDAWHFLLGEKLPAYFLQSDLASERPIERIATLRTKLLEDVSAKLRTLFLKLCPQLVTTAEQLSRNVYYIPVSSTGVPPQDCKGECSVGPAPLDGTPKFCFTAGNIEPVWAEVPFLWMASRHIPGLIPFQK